MKISITVAQVLALLAAAVAVSAQPEGDYSIDTTSNRAPKLFDPPSARKGGYTYVDELSVKVGAQVETSGMTMKVSLDAMGDTEMVVKNRPQSDGGGTGIDITVENLKTDLHSFMMTLRCDSNDRDHSDPQCAELLFPVVGKTETIEMDGLGELVSVTTFDGQTFDMAQLTESANAMTMSEKFKPHQFAASTHIDKTSQMFKLIPDHAVRPGDAWIDDVDMGNMGTFKGNSYFKGYTNYKNSDCAVFYFEGILHLDVSTIARAIGVDAAGTIPTTTMVDAKITNVIFYDVQDEFSRWAQANITTSFDIPNPMDPTDPNTMHIPVELTVSLATDITARPEHDESAGVSESYMSPPKAYTTATESSSSSSGGGGGSAGGYVAGLLVAIAVGMAAAAGLFLYNKRLQQEAHGDFFVRPSYEFSPVASEPIFLTTSPMV